MTTVRIYEGTLPAVMGIVYVTCLLTIFVFYLTNSTFLSDQKCHFLSGQQATAFVVALVQASTPWMLLQQG